MTITDPDEVEDIIATRRMELEESTGSTAGYERLPAVVAQVLGSTWARRTPRPMSRQQRRGHHPRAAAADRDAADDIAGLSRRDRGDGGRVAVDPSGDVAADRVVSYVAAITNGLPAWWAGIMLILILTFWLRVLPDGGMYSTPPPQGVAPTLDLAWHALLPILTLVLVSIGPSIYVIRTMTLNVALSDHVTVARAKGLPERLIRRRHILRVAAPPIVTGLILGLAATLGGSILIETVFAWEGMGQLYFKTFSGEPDESIIIGLTFMFTLIYVGARLLLEILYVFLDPRVRYQ